MGVNIKSHYDTKDMGLAATLACNDVSPAELICVDKSNRKFVFRFLRNDNTMKIIDTFYANKSMVNPIELLKHVRLLKARMESYNESSS
jgi:hypothetical protein